ncbi:hypothetical protein MNV_470010 [Candidatus Methanoperedens nitroreducens]|uniref:Uncharacterized protein n=1 Tax=Candidatus Methanoperedens nitratireducens TaxID=1392998 RepID=A0A284VR47_9EURY|nr:hypothetical protein MNV_470010 [Candidatus Methanoperedens nitroreducens]
MYIKGRKISGEWEWGGIGGKKYPLISFVVKRTCSFYVMNI